MKTEFFSFRLAAAIAGYFKSLLETSSKTKRYVGAMLGLAVILFFWSAAHSDTERLEKILNKRVASGHLAKAEWYAVIWEPRAAKLNAGLCVVLAACWPLVDRGLQSRRGQ